MLAVQSNLQCTENDVNLKFPRIFFRSLNMLVLMMIFISCQDVPQESSEMKNTRIQMVVKFVKCNQIDRNFGPKENGCPKLSHPRKEEEKKKTKTRNYD